ncbi:alpha/beta hydrolase [Massilia sp. W12]|uniref:alpha/beta hydrolase n=1 Tax=Massilia sp. W12 TaxID=3126507 RepID=UPI0030D2C571
MTASTTCPEAQAAAVRVAARQIPGPCGPLQARLYSSAESSANSGAAAHGIVFFHAGGFVCGSLDEADHFVRALAVVTQLPVLSCSYRLAGCGEHKAPFPAAVEDAYAALCWAVSHPKQCGGARQWLLAGLEAGGNLAAVACMMARDRGKPAVAAQMLLMPMLDPGLSSASMRALCNKPQAAGVADACARAYTEYLPRACDRAHPYASPLASSRIKGLPPALLISADDDPLRDEALAYAHKLQAGGVTARHLRLSAPSLTDGAARAACARQQPALQAICEFLRESGFIPGQETA